MVGSLVVGLNFVLVAWETGPVSDEASFRNPIFGDQGLNRWGLDSFGFRFRSLDLGLSGTYQAQQQHNVAYFHTTNPRGLRDK